MALFAERAADYRAVVERVPESGLASAVARVLTARATAVPGPFLIPEGLPADWLPAPSDSTVPSDITALPDGIAVAGDTPPRSAAGLDRMAGVVTGCAVAIAETGTIILDHGPGQGRRALTLVPDFHLVIAGPARSTPTWPTRSPGSTRPARTPSSPVPRPPVTSNSSESRACTAPATSTFSSSAPDEPASPS